MFSYILSYKIEYSFNIAISTEAENGCFPPFASVIQTNTMLYLSCRIKQGTLLQTGLVVLTGLEPVTKRL